MKVRLTVDREDPRTGETERTSASTFVTVAVDESGTPVPVPDLRVESDRDVELRERGSAGET